MDNKFYRLFVFCVCFCFVAISNLRAQQSTNISVVALKTPATLNVASNDSTFIVRVNNITASAITGVVLRDTMPAGIVYTVGSVSGTGVTVGTPSTGNIIHFNIASVPASGYIDVTFKASAGCGAPSTGTVQNKYKATWGTSFSSIVTVPVPLSFPSLSVTIIGGNSVVANCQTKFVRQIQVCNGGYGPVDSVTVSDTESNNSLTIINMDKGTFSFTGTNAAKTVLKAADFMAVGNNDGKLDGGECIIVNDTLIISGSTSPINGVIRADWGINGAFCTNGTTNNVQTTAVNINAASTAPALTRSLSVIGNNPGDSAQNIFGNVMTYREVVKNTSTVVAKNCKIYPAVLGLKYIDADSIWASLNGGARYHPTYNVNYGSGYWFTGTPDNSMRYAVLDTTYTGKSSINNARLDLGDLQPGDSIVVTFVVRTAGPITRVGDYSINHCSAEKFCGSCYRISDGPSIGGAVDAQLYWEGCPGGSYSNCVARFPTSIFNGKNTVATPEYDASYGTAHYIGRFRNYAFIDSTDNVNRCAYYEGDTVKVLLSAGVMDLPFYTEKSKFFIRIKTSGGVKWDGDLSSVFGRLNSWTGNTPWYADHVVDKSDIDSTIEVHFKIGNCPVPDFTTKDAYNSYSGGGFQLAIHFINTCPGPAVKRVMMTRVYTIDTTGNDLAIEAGSNIFPANQNWNSTCSGPCADGVSILSYEHKRITFGKPDNNDDGIADSTGVLNMSRIRTNLITWGDTLQLKYKMVVHSTNLAGVPNLYMESSINYTVLSAAIEANNFLKKEPPMIKVKTTTGQVYTGVGSTGGVNTGNSYLLNMSLTDTGGVNIPGYAAYKNGDTVELTENVIYWGVHYGFSQTEWGFLHVPYTSNVINPTPAQKMKCDSVICNFSTVDYTRRVSGVRKLQGQCADSSIMELDLSTFLTGGTCGVNPFPGEVRRIATPEIMKVVIPASSGWIVKNVLLYYQNKLQGTGSCSYPVNNVQISPSLYTFSGDTIILNARTIVQSFGYNIDEANLRNYVYFDLMMQKVNLPNACSIDHVNTTSPNFPILFSFKTERPMDSAGNATYLNGSTAYSIYLNTPNGPIVNTALNSGAATITVNTPKNVINYSFLNTDNFGNKFLAIPNRPGIIVDSVRDAATNVKLVNPPGTDIYQIGNFTGTKNYSIYTTTTLCNDDTLFVYADRAPCSGYPSTYASYDCKNYMDMGFTKFVTIQGELQMQDSLFTTQKDICTKDTVQFKVVNSQTPSARDIKVSFTLPTGLLLNAGETQLQIGTGAFVTVSDPVLSGGIYSWTLPASDSLPGVSSTPANVLRLRVGISTQCGYNVGSIINSSINGNVGCGAITSLFNSNPPTIGINGAPVLNYLSNVKGIAEQISGINNPLGYNYSVSMKLSGVAPTGTNDSVTVVLPVKYKFVSYNPVMAGAHNAPLGQPNIQILGNGDRRVTWSLPPGVSQSDSIKFTFKYNELNKENKCGISPSNNSFVSTSISGVVYCATTGTNCSIGIVNGQDTVGLQSIKPSLQVGIGSSFFYHCAAPPACGKDFVSMTGTLYNSGSAPVPPGTAVYMEVFFDSDNSSTVTAGDKALTTFVTTAGIPAGGSLPFTYSDTLSTACNACVGKSLLIRFDEYPGGNPVQQQVLCDSSLTQSAGVPAGLLPVSLVGTVFNDKNCNISSQGNPELGESVINGTNTGAGLTTGSVLYANLINSGNKVIATTPIAIDGTYQFPLVTRNASGLTVQLSTIQGVVNSTKPATVMPTGWATVGESNNGQAGNLEASPNGELPIKTDSVNITQQNFAIERLPNSDDKSIVVPQPSAQSIAAGVVTTAISGMDAEDGIYGNAQPIKITQLPINSTMLYNGVAVTLNQLIPSFNPALLAFNTIGLGAASTNFKYAYIDNCGKQDATPATYTISWGTPLAVKLVSFTATPKEKDVLLNWVVASELNVQHYEVEFSSNAVSFASIGSENATNATTYSLLHKSPVNGSNYYRLKIVDNNNKYSYSEVRVVRFGLGDDDILVYPIPATNVIKITFNQELIGKAGSISLIAADGKTVLKKKMANINPNEELDVAEILNGHYVLQIVTAKGVINRVVIIVR